MKAENIMILVTGVTGNIGGRVAELLAQRNIAMRLGARTPQEAPKLPNTEAVAFDYEQPDQMIKALEGIETIFITSIYGKPGDRAKLHINVIDAAKSAGVKNIVYLSFQGASPDSAFAYSVDHWQTEEHLKATGLNYTILRSNYYMDLLIEMAGDEYIIHGPAENGKVGWVSREDVAQTVAAVLADGKHTNETLDVTGPESFDLAAACSRLTLIGDNTIYYDMEELDEARTWRIESGADPIDVDVWLGSYIAMAKGEVEALSDTVERKTGRKPYTLEEYFKAYPDRMIFA